MIDKNQMSRVQLANQLPLNRIAAKWLPGGKPLQTEMAVLTLMRWALDNQREPGQFAAHHPNYNQLGWQIDMMTDREPRRAIACLTNPEGGEDEEVFSPDDLEGQPTAEDAAEFLLENLYSAMVATAP